MLAILLLDERVTAPIAAGTVVIVAGTILRSAGGRRFGVRPAQLGLPLLSAACFDVVGVLRKLGLSGAGPLVGSAVNATTAHVAFTACGLRPPRCHGLSGGRGLVHFVIAGVMDNAVLNGRVVLGTLLMVAGVYLITASGGP